MLPISRFDKSPLQRRIPVFSGALNVNENALAKVVVTVIFLISLAFWIKAERAELYRRACDVDCSTDFSASRK